MVNRKPEAQSPNPAKSKKLASHEELLIPNKRYDDLDLEGFVPLREFIAASARRQNRVVLKQLGLLPTEKLGELVRFPIGNEGPQEGRTSQAKTKSAAQQQGHGSSVQEDDNYETDDRKDEKIG